jgi:hypothetical protein
VNKDKLKSSPTKPGANLVVLHIAQCTAASSGANKDIQKIQFTTSTRAKTCTKMSQTTHPFILEFAN